MSFPDLYSVTIKVDGKNVDQNRLGSASIIMGAVSLAIQGTSMIVSGVRAKRQREEFLRQTENLNKIRNFSAEAINAYNEELWQMLEQYDTQRGRISGLRASTEYEGLINDGVGEMQYYFPGGFQAALRAYNDESERVRKEYAENPARSPAENINRQKTQEARFKELSKRFSWYGLKPFLSTEKNAYLIAENDNTSEWNNQRIENWFTVDKNGNFHKKSSQKGRRSERKDEDQKWGMRERVRNDWVERVRWFENSGLMSWILKGYLTGKGASELGRKQAREDYALVFERAKKIAEEEALKAIENKVEQGEPIEQAIEEVQYVVDAPEPKVSVIDKVKTWWGKRDEKDKKVMILGGSSAFALAMILRRN